MNSLDLVEKLKGKTAEEQARMISAYYASKTRKQATEAYRAGVRAKCFAGCKKITKAQQEVYLYEYLEANQGYISNWFVKNKPELRSK